MLGRVPSFVFWRKTTTRPERRVECDNAGDGWSQRNLREREWLAGEGGFIWFRALIRSQTIAAVEKDPSSYLYLHSLPNG